MNSPAFRVIWGLVLLSALGWEKAVSLPPHTHTPELQGGLENKPADGQGTGKKYFFKKGGEHESQRPSHLNWTKQKAQYHWERFSYSCFFFSFASKEFFIRLH